jgi:hypothetical protein
MPLLDLRAKPQLAAALTEIDDWPRHRGVPPLVRRHGVALREAKEVGDPLRVNHIVGVDAAAHDS